jgi:hypothetical protein
MMPLDLTFAKLASEYWKLHRSFERMADLVPADARARYLAQARYAASRLESLLGEEQMRVVSFDAQPFEVNLPAIAVNAEDVAGLDRLVVERTIEPAIVRDMDVILTGKVLLVQPPSSGDR